jgi:hypothetical protein
MMQGHEKAPGVFVGTIPEAQWQFWLDQLEEESTDDTDSYIDQARLDLFEEVGARPPCWCCSGRPWGRAKASRLSGPECNA